LVDRAVRRFRNGNARPNAPQANNVIEAGSGAAAGSKSNVVELPATPIVTLST
jgi:hypothetical protein